MGAIPPRIYIFIISGMYAMPDYSFLLTLDILALQLHLEHVIFFSKDPREIVIFAIIKNTSVLKTGLKFGFD